MGFGISLKDTEVQIAALPIGRQPALPSEPQLSHREMLDVVYDNTTDASIGFEAGVPHSKDVLVVSLCQMLQEPNFTKSSKNLYLELVFGNQGVCFVFFLANRRQAFVLFLVSSGFYSPRGAVFAQSLSCGFFFFR